MSQKVPIPQVIADPVLVDKEIKDIQTQMATISWIDFSFGRAFKYFRENNGVKVSWPAIFQAKNKDYYNAYPNDNIKKGYSFIYVDPSSVVEFNVKRSHNIEQEISLIVFFNKKLIDDTLNEDITEKLKEDVIFALSSLKPNRLEINNITNDIEESFNDFTPTEIKSEFLKSKFGAFKFDCTVFYANDNCALNIFTP